MGIDWGERINLWVERESREIFILRIFSAKRQEWESRQNIFSAHFFWEKAGILAKSLGTKRGRGVEGLKFLLHPLVTFFNATIYHDGVSERW
jgi:hypothetical protein